MTEPTRSTWDVYARAWKETSAARKLDALRQSASPTCTYRDPNVVVEGHAALVDYMLAFHRDVPGGWFDTTHFLAHHGRSIARWNMVSESGQILNEGVSYAEYDAENRLLVMTGFFEPSRPERPE